jgi:hypothetical protein
MNTFSQLMMMSPKTTDEHRAAINNALAEARQIDDFQLTFGTFLPICQKLLEADEKQGANSPR